MDKMTNNITTEEEVVGYESCDSSATQCLDDCTWPFPDHVFSYNN